MPFQLSKINHDDSDFFFLYLFIYIFIYIFIYLFKQITLGEQKLQNHQS